MHPRDHHRIVTTLPAALILAAGLLASGAALAADYELCVDIRVQNSDSGFINATGITEDYHLTRTETTVPGYGFYVKAVTGNQTLVAGYTDSNTGCIQFSDSSPAGSNYIADVTVLSIARHGTTYLRAHDAGSTGTSPMPGQLFAVAFPDKLIPPGVTKRVTIPLDPTWNAFATGSFALSRVRTGLAGKTISMGFDDATSSSIFSGATAWIEQNAHLVRVNNPSRQLMFEVVHELGHAAARLNYGHNGAESAFSDEFVYPGNDTNDCDNDSSYDLRSVEWDGMGFKEGFANLYAARVFNDRDDDGAIRILSRSMSLERFQAASLGNPSGGHIRNHCYAGSTPDHGVSTTEDWTRFLWDIYTIPTDVCGPQLGLDDMYDIYTATRDLGPTDVDAWHTDIMTAIHGLSSLSSCEKTQAEEFANWNAIGGVYHTY